MLDAGCHSQREWCCGKRNRLCIVFVATGIMNPLREKGRTFTLDMGSDGAASLQKVILKKLTEFMGDYSDDVLAQYVLVLVAHGKQQAQAVKDLEAFLGDRSESFVAWLWDYLWSNLHLHASVSKASEFGGNEVEHKVDQTDNGTVKLVKADEKVSSLGNKRGKQRTHLSSVVRSIPNRNDPSPIVWNSEIGSVSEQVEAKNRNAGKHSRQNVKRPGSPLDTQIQTERDRRSDVRHRRKRHSSPSSVNATRRLLQSAVREAVGPVAGLTKSGSKRLRSVVSTEFDGLENTDAYKNAAREEKIVLPTLPVYTKEVASTPQNDEEGLVGSVWERLGRTAKYRKKEEGIHNDHESQTIRVGNSRFTSENTYTEDEVNGIKLSVHQSRLSDQDFDERIVRTAENSIAERPDNVGQGGQYELHIKEVPVFNHTQSQRFQGNDDQGMCVGVSNTDKVSKRALYANAPVRSVDTETRGAQDVALPGPSSRQFDSSEELAVCSQDREPESFQMEQVQTQFARHEGDSDKDFLDLKKRLDQVQTEMLKLRAKQSDSNKETQNVISPGNEEVTKMRDSLQSRTVFVTNIHFAATKESIIAHFTQCGKIEQVVVLTDAATGKPKGSAYVEFNAKAEAEKALTLNETSFYSRILKVVLTDSSSIQEMLSSQSASIRRPSSLPSRPSTRGRFFRNAHNSHGFANMRGAYATPAKLQWKRDSTATGGTVNGLKSVGQGLSTHPGVKSFTYIRNQSASAAKVGFSEGQKGAM